MRLALVSPRFFPMIGGVEFHVMQIAKCLTRRAIEIDVLTTDPTGRLQRNERIDSISVTRFKSWAPGGSYHFSQGLKRYLGSNSSKYDIIHAHSYHDLPALYASQTKSENGRLVFTPHYHGAGHSVFRDLLHRPYKLLGKKIFEKADAIICVSNYEKDLVISNFDSIQGKKITVIPNGVDQNAPRRLDASNDTKTVLYVGRLEKYKQIDTLIRAMAYLSQDQRIRLEIIGKGPERNRLEMLAKRTFPNSFFVEELPRNELLEAYANASVLVNLSNHEAYGLTVAEALSAGTPCVVSNSGALREWIDDENCLGVQEPKRNPMIVAEAIRLLVGKRVIEYRCLPDWSWVAEQTLQVYERILS